MAEVITDHLDLWTSALLTKSTAGRGSNGRLEAYGIKKLRELIYELAANGLLVDDTGDVAVRTIKIGDVADLVMGQAPPGNECNKNGVGTVFVKTGEFGQLYPEVVEWTTKPLKLARAGDVLICVVGATVGKLNLAIDCAIGRSVAAIRPRGDVDTKYLYFSLMPYTLKLRDQSRGSAQGVIGKEELNAVEIRLPSLKEQHRIVARVDKLMTLCDQLEQQQTDSLEAHKILVETLLSTLTLVESQQEFSAAWARIASHFDTLFTTEESIDQLKQTILELAVMGKLVPQDPNDEPVSELLEKIAEEKTRLIKDGAIKNEKSLPSISNEEIPFDVPEGWTWQRLGELGFTQTGGTPSKTNKEHFGNDIPFIKPGDIYPGCVDYDNEGLSNEGAKALGRTAPAGSILMVCIGTIGKCNIIERTCAFNQQINSISPYIEMGSYLLTALGSVYFQKSAWERSSRTTIAILNKGKWVDIVVPIPPLAEQHRIVAKVDELMALCDALKACLADAQTAQLHLADAIVEQAILV